MRYLHRSKRFYMLTLSSRLPVKQPNLPLVRLHLAAVLVCLYLVAICSQLNLEAVLTSLLLAVYLARLFKISAVLASSRLVSKQNHLSSHHLVTLLSVQL